MKFENVLAKVGQWAVMIIASSLFWYSLAMWVVEGIDKTMVLRGF